MKTIKPILSILSIVFLSHAARGQELISNMYLKGSWNASCLTEVRDHATIGYCELCTFNTDTNDKSIGSVGDVKLTFGEDSLTIGKNGKNITVPYQRNKDNHSFTFTTSRKEYHFRVFFDGEKRIIEDDKGMLMVLEKEKSH